MCSAISHPLHCRRRPIKSLSEMCVYLFFTGEMGVKRKRSSAVSPMKLSDSEFEAVPAAAQILNPFGDRISKPQFSGTKSNGSRKAARQSQPAKVVVSAGGGHALLFGNQAKQALSFGQARSNVAPYYMRDCPL